MSKNNSDSTRLWQDVASVLPEDWKRPMPVRSSRSVDDEEYLEERSLVLEIMAGVASVTFIFFAIYRLIKNKKDNS